jgi:hypothetical protein
MQTTTAKTLASILRAVRDYTPDDVTDAVNVLLIELKFDERKVAQEKATVIRACDDALAFWQKVPQGAESGNLMAVAAIRAFVENI